MIKNLLFDLGGVIMDIRRSNCVEAFRELGMENPDDFLGEYRQQGPFAAVEDGSMSARQFRDAIRPALRLGTTDREIDKAFGRFLTGIPAHRLDELECLRRHYKVYLLSNTNPIMWNDGIAAGFRQRGHNVDHYFDGILRSYEAKCMKPDAKIFRLCCQRFGLRPEETIFLDDSQTNLDAAAQLGFRTQLVAPGHEMFQLLGQRDDITISPCNE